MRRTSRLWRQDERGLCTGRGALGIERARALGLALMLAAGVGTACVQAAQRYPLKSGLVEASSTTGTLSVERVEGGQRLVVVQLSELPPPERIGPGLKQFVVWLSSPSGQPQNAGTLEYDREHQSGSLLATTNLGTFTVTVTGERDPGVRTPSAVRLAERKVVTN